MNPLDLVTLNPLMRLTRGKPEVKIGMIDGPVEISHPEFAKANIHAIARSSQISCLQDNSPACRHGTSVASILCGQRNLSSPAICPGCSLFVRPVFTEILSSNFTPRTTPENLSAAILECLRADVQILHLSMALLQK